MHPPWSDSSDWSFSRYLLSRSACPGPRGVIVSKTEMCYGDASIPLGGEAFLASGAGMTPCAPVCPQGPAWNLIGNIAQSLLK